MTLSSRSAERVLALYEAARINGSLISLREIIPLLPENGSESELSEVIKSAPILKSKLTVRLGYVVGRNDVDGRVAIQAEESSRVRADSNLRVAARFVPMIDGESLLLAAVSGSTSYGSASSSVDIDFFLVARPGALWVLLTRSFLMARVFRLTNRDSPDICFSCVMDASYAARSFQQTKSPLFARDSLQAIVLKGEDVYDSLLVRARWMSELYPSLYAARTGSYGGQDRLLGTTAGTAVVDRYLAVLIGLYVRVKCLMKNKILLKSRREGDLFELLTGNDHLVYESRRYKRTHAAYLSKNTRVPTMATQSGDAAPLNDPRS